MKKTLSILLTLCLLASATLLPASAAVSKFIASGINYNYPPWDTVFPLEIEDNGEVTIKGNSNDPIVVKANATATLTLVEDGAEGTPANAPAITLESGAHLTLILADGTTNKFIGGGAGNPGILVPDDASLTIQGNTGTLEATGAECTNNAGSGAGIGSGGGDAGLSDKPGDAGGDSGPITIEGGVVTATGGAAANGGSGAGIGTGGGGQGGSNFISSDGSGGSGGNGGVSGPIAIEGGVVTATGGAAANGGSGAGIGTGGGGYGGSGDTNGGAGGNAGNADAITIEGGVIKATGGVAVSGGNGAGIGTGGGGTGHGANTVNGGDGGNGGNGGTVSTITIESGDITAAGGSGAGIGSGSGGQGGLGRKSSTTGGAGGASGPVDAITVTGGNITATGSAGIGSGAGGTGGNGLDGSGNGKGGDSGNVDTIAIENGIVTAAEIGAGVSGKGGNSEGVDLGDDGTLGTLATLRITSGVAPGTVFPCENATITGQTIAYTNRRNQNQAVALRYVDYESGTEEKDPTATLPTAGYLHNYDATFPAISQYGWTELDNTPAGQPGDFLSFALANPLTLYNTPSSKNDEDPDALYEIATGKDIQNGTVSANRAKATFGALVTVTLRPDKEFEYDEGTLYFIEEETGHKTFIEAYDESTDKYTFPMPADNITIYAEFIPVLYDITIDENIELGMVDTDVFEAAKGDLISVYAAPDATYQLIEGSLTYQLGDRKPVKIVDYQFEMPSGEVEITAQFERKEIYILDDHLYDKDGNQLFNQEYIDEDGNHYYFDENGEMLRDTFRFIANSRDVYYYGSDGKMVKDTRIDDFYFGPDGKRVYNQFIDFTDSEGNIYTMYFGEDGVFYRDILVKIGEYWYYFDENGVMVKDREVSFPAS